MKLAASLRHSLFMYRRLAGLSIQSQLRYRSSLLLSIVSQFLIIGVEFLALYLMFQRFRSFMGWSLPEMAVLYGLVNTCFALADALAYGFDQMGPLLKNGNFDRLLLRPLPLLVQLLGMEVTIRRAGRLLLGISTFGWGLSGLLPTIQLGAPALALLLAATVAGTLVFLLIFLVQAACTFVTIEGLEFMNAFSYGGQQAASHPLLGYRRAIQVLFTGFIPIGACIYLPLCLILGRVGLPGLPAWAHAAGPLAVLPFGAFALALWHLGVCRYSSAGG